MKTWREAPIWLATPHEIASIFLSILGASVKHPFRQYSRRVCLSRIDIYTSCDGTLFLLLFFSLFPCTKRHNYLLYHDEMGNTPRNFYRSFSSFPEDRYFLLPIFLHALWFLLHCDHFYYIFDRKNINVYVRVRDKNLWHWSSKL